MDIMQPWDWTKQSEKYHRFTDYLNTAEVVFLDDERYDLTKERFLMKNREPVAVLPGPVITPEEAYFAFEKFHFYTTPVEEKKKTSGCGLPESVLTALFLLQHVKYSEYKKETSGKVYTAERTYFEKENQALLKSMIQNPDNIYIKAMIDWARSQKPVQVKDKVRTVRKKTPGRPGSLTFYRIGGGFAGGGEPYDEDQSVYREMDVFLPFK